MGSELLLTNYIKKMAHFRKKPVVVEAITFNELVAFGHSFIEQNPTQGNYASGDQGGLPWSFKYKGHLITHENDQCYLIPTLEGTHHMTPQDLLITGVKGEIYPCKKDIFDATYDKVENTGNSIGELRVRSSFNPESNNVVDVIKQKTAELINLCEELKTKDGRLASLAQTDFEKAAMWAVKAATATQSA